MASNCDLIHYSLVWLHNQWCKHESGGGQSESLRSVCGSIRELDKDWSFLKMFVESISKWSDADKVIEKNNSGGESLVLLKSLDSSKECNQFPRLSFLTQMESLKIVYRRRVLDRSEFDFPFRLKKLTLSNFKLTLSNFYLPWNHISVIGRLPNLEVLKLLSGMFDGEIWDMREEEFQQLKFLKLEALNIAEWNATCDQLPQLERLVLRNCKALEKVPNDLADIATLQMIEVHWCRESEEESAKEIGEATEDIKILINRS